MKRTEKIEIRLSQVEKTALSTLASSEGRTVSTLIRDLVRKYMELNTPNTKSRHLWPRMAAVLSFGVLLGAVIPIKTLMTKTTGEIEQYTVHGIIGDAAFGVSIMPIFEGPKIHTLKSSEGDITISLRVLNGEEKKLLVKFCTPMQDRCETVAQATLPLEPYSPSMWQTKGKNGANVFVTVQRMAWPNS